eukprot:TRINITY_DN3978_c2_g1_i1.p1 TRINITY_DN3978_c2_g1~~TRINITY_DN3978_c2_g1_i1.p1  ORF type:complete len:784 (-),score=150.82 TRINITY_DN3978_c2_g1_i1:81-2432(-)
MPGSSGRASLRNAITAVSSGGEDLLRKYGSLVQGDSKEFLPTDKTCLCRIYARLILESTTADVTFGLVIIANAIVIGVEQTFRLEDKDLSVFEALEHVFLTIYLTELILRFSSYGVACLRDNFVKLDLFLVIMSIITEWIFALAVTTASDDMKSLSLLRTARMARLARSLRLFSKFPGLWMLVQGIMTSASTIFYTIMLLTITLYVFASLGLEVITLEFQGREEGEVPDIVQAVVDEYFPSLPRTMLSLVQFVTMDSLGVIYRPLAAYNAWLALYFLAVILTVSILIMNIITASIVNGAIEQANQDKEARRILMDKVKNKMMKQLREMFIRLDADSSGEIDREEIKNATGEDAALLNDFMSISSPLEVFDALDVDGSGCLDIDEFCEGLYHASVSKAPIEIKRMERKLDSVHRKLYNVQAKSDQERSTSKDTNAHNRAFYDLDAEGSNEAKLLANIYKIVQDTRNRITFLEKMNTQKDRTPSQYVPQQVPQQPQQPPQQPPQEEVEGDAIAPRVSNRRAYTMALGQSESKRTSTKQPRKSEPDARKSIAESQDSSFARSTSSVEPATSPKTVEEVPHGILPTLSSAGSRKCGGMAASEELIAGLTATIDELVQVRLLELRTGGGAMGTSSKGQGHHGHRASPGVKKIISRELLELACEEASKVGNDAPAGWSLFTSTTITKSNTWESTATATTADHRKAKTRRPICESHRPQDADDSPQNAEGSGVAWYEFWRNVREDPDAQPPNGPEPDGPQVDEVFTSEELHVHPPSMSRPSEPPSDLPLA